MHMKERFLVATATTALLLTGLTSSVAAEDNPVGVAGQPVITAESGQRLFMDPAQLVGAYPELPSAVAETEQAAVAVSLIAEYVTFVAPDGKETTVTPSFQGSGTILDITGTRVALTAAHMVQAAPGQCIPAELHRDVDGDQGVETALSEASRQSRADLKPTELHDPNYNGKLDAAVVIPDSPESIELYDRSALVPQEKVDVRPGQVFFAINYQPTAEGEDRGPQHEGKFGRAAIYAHVALGRVGDEVVSLVGLASYDAVGDSVAIAGSSGGQLVTPEGLYVGDTIASNRLPETDEYIESIFPGIDLPDGTGYRLAYSRIIDQDTAERMLDQAQSAAPCTKEPPERTVPLLPGEDVDAAMVRIGPK